LLALVREARLPTPEMNVIVRGLRSSHRADAYWREQRLVVELDGYRCHSSRHAFERDREATADLQDAGIEVLRATVRQIAERRALLGRLERRLR
jgi:very-short-patch-repair endonuclease